MFAYCGNNPANRLDCGGNFWDTIFDVVSLVASVADVVANPTDAGAWVGLACDIVDVAIPCVGGLGEIADAINATRKATKTADKLRDAEKTASLFVVIGENTERVAKYANSIGADYLKVADDLLDDDMMMINRKWINDAMNDGRIIIDIGPDFARRTNTGVISEFYEMERKLTKDYTYYVKSFIRNGDSSIIMDW